MLGLVDELLWVEGLPNYQDLSFKLNYPLKKGNFSVFGFGGTSRITGTIDDTTSYPGNVTHELAERTGSKTGVIGFNYIHFFSDRTRIINNLAISLTRPFERVDSVIDGEFTKFRLNDFFVGKRSDNFPEIGL